MRLTKVFGYLTVLLIALLLLSACAPGEGGEEPAFPEAGTPFAGETEVLPPTGPLDSTPQDPLEVTPTEPLDATPLVAGDTPAATPIVTEGVDTTPEAGTTPLVPATPEATEAAGTEAPDTGGPPSSSGAEILPETGRADLTRLSALMGYQVIDQDGETLGTANDFILNLCESHILYIVLDADPALELQGGDQTLIPYEMVSLHSGVLNSEDQTIQVNVGLSEVQTAPVTSQDTFDVTTNEWEAEVQSFWTTFGNLSLTTECRVPGATTGTGDGTEGTPAAGTPTAPATGQERVALHKNAFASDVIGAVIVDGNGEELGTVEEVLMEPESGRLTFAAVRMNAGLQADQNLVLVPFGALNLQEEGASDGVTMELLVEPSVLSGAPQEPLLPATEDTGWESQSLDYWGEFVPLTRDQLP